MAGHRRRDSVRRDQCRRRAGSPRRGITANDVAAVRALLDKHADVNAARPDGTTALHWAVDRDAPEIVQLLVRAGANVKAANRYGATPLWLAALNGNAATIGMLLEAAPSASAARLKVKPP